MRRWSFRQVQGLSVKSVVSPSVHWSQHRKFTSSRLDWNFCLVNGQSIGSLDCAPLFHWLSFRLCIREFNGPSAKSMVSTSVHWIFRLYFASSCVDCPSAKSKACQSSRLSVLQSIGLSTVSLLLLASTGTFT